MLFQKIVFKARILFMRKRSAEKSVLFSTQVSRSVLTNCIDFKGSAWSGRLIQKGWNILSYVIFLPPSTHYRCTSVVYSTFPLYSIEKKIPKPNNNSLYYF